MTAYELLMSCPDGQVIRCKTAVNAIIKGQWADAKFWLLNAAREEDGTEWGQKALEVAAGINS